MQPLHTPILLGNNAAFCAQATIEHILRETKALTLFVTHYPQARCCCCLPLQFALLVAVPLYSMNCLLCTVAGRRSSPAKRPQVSVLCIASSTLCHYVRRWQCCRKSTQHLWHAATWHLCRMPHWILLCLVLTCCMQLSSSQAASSQATSSRAASRPAARAQWQQRAAYPQTAPGTSPGDMPLGTSQAEICETAGLSVLVCAGSMCGNNTVAAVETVGDHVALGAGSHSCSS
jgi:hypothetical protein